MNNVIWSSNGTENYVLGLSKEEKINFLSDRGYDPEMIANYDDEDINDIIATDDYMWQDDIEDFEESIVPMINSQTLDGMVLMIGDAARWDGTRQAGLCVDTSDLVGGDIDKDVNNIEIIDDGDGLVWEGSHHDGTHHMNLYAIPEDHDRQREFVEMCMKEYLETLIDWNEYELEDAIEDVLADLNYSIDYSIINDYCDFSKVPEVCQRVKNNLSKEGITEGKSINEVKAKDPKGLRAEYEEIKDLSDEYGKEYFTSMPFTAYDDDPESVEKKYPNFFRVVKSFFKEMGILNGEELNDSDALDSEWDSDIDNHDWEVIMKVCDRLTTPNKRSGKFEPSQFEKIYKDNFDDGLNDDDILASREENEFEEDLSLETVNDLIKDEEEAVDGYKDALKDDPTPEDAETLEHIKDEEKEHIEELRDLKSKNESLNEGNNAEFDSTEEAIAYWEKNHDIDPGLAEYGNDMNAWLKVSKENGYIADESLNEAPEGADYSKIRSTEAREMEKFAKLVDAIDSNVARWAHRLAMAEKAWKDVSDTQNFDVLEGIWGDIVGDPHADEIWLNDYTTKEGEEYNIIAKNHGYMLVLYRTSDEYFAEESYTEGVNHLYLILRGPEDLDGVFYVDKDGSHHDDQYLTGWTINDAVTEYGPEAFNDLYNRSRESANQLFNEFYQLIDRNLESAGLTTESINHDSKDKSLKEESKLSEEIVEHSNKYADAFIQYLKDNDGWNDDDDYHYVPGVVHEPFVYWGKDFVSIDVYSDYASITWLFYDNGEVEVEYVDKENHKNDVSKKFDSYSDFAEWYKTKSFSWTSDLGGNIPLIDDSKDEDLNEDNSDDIEWPWGDPGKLK